MESQSPNNERSGRDFQVRIGRTTPNDDAGKQVDASWQTSQRGERRQNVAIKALMSLSAAFPSHLQSFNP
jgi:hypothetical protein